MTADPCSGTLECPSVAHDRECPWHPRNTASLTLPAPVFDKLLADLERPGRVLPKLREQLERQRAVRSWL
jgi:hypothetical protein